MSFENCRVQHRHADGFYDYKTGNCVAPYGQMRRKSRLPAHGLCTLRLVPYYSWCAIACRDISRAACLSTRLAVSFGNFSSSGMFRLFARLKLLPM